MYETPYAILEPDTPYPRPEKGKVITFLIEKSRGGELVEVPVRIDQIIVDPVGGQAKVLCRTVKGNCFATALFRHTDKQSDRYNGRITISDDCRP